MPTQQLPTILVVSDGRGQTGARVLQAALVQFQGQKHHIVTEGNVRTVERVGAILENAARIHAVVLFTLVEEATRRAMQQGAAQLAVPVVDVLGPTLSALHDLLQRDSAATPGLLYAAEREDIDRHDAIDYTLKHDDGRRPDELDQAGVVLVGVSRTAKSTTCFYLAYHGVRAANVPLLPGVALPPRLLALPPERVIGLWVNPSRLLTVRAARARHLNLGADSSYLDRDAVLQEVRDAHRVMNRHGWRTVDASYMAVEEIAREVMRLCDLPERSLG
jgi:[pyruvate, water dikinase]-phosphate phosphotransferase / [pyruvate, water dikinase] kinase